MLPVLRPVGGDEEVKAIRESIESGWWGKGPKVAEFEKKFAEMVGAKYAVAVNSATSGQDLVLKALDIKDLERETQSNFTLLNDEEQKYLSSNDIILFSIPVNTGNILNVEPGS